MGRYITTHGQNLYDVALHIYGSIEGIVDLMMNNTTLSLNDNLKAGTELLYTDNFIINSDTAYYLKIIRLPLLTENRASISNPHKNRKY